MKSTAAKIAIAILILGLIIGGILYYLNKSKKVDTSTDAGSLEPGRQEPKPAPPVEPLPVQTQGAANSNDTPTLFIDSGEGLKQVNARMKTLYLSSDYDGIKAAQIYKLFETCKYPNGMKQGMVANFGSLNKIPVIPDFFDPGFSTAWEGVQSIEGFEKLKNAAGFNTALNTWQGALSIQDFNYFPSNLSALIESGQFGATTKADKDRSERYDAFTTDAKTFAKNMVKLCKDMTTALRAQAINDLVGAGYKFYGQS